MKKISIIIPCFNESANLNRLYEELAQFSQSNHFVKIQNDSHELLISEDMNDFEFEFIFIDDGSTDDTSKILQSIRNIDQRVSFLILSRNFGKENAMLAGMDNATGDAVITIDADLQHPLNVIPEMIYWWNKGYDDIYGKNINRVKDGFLRKSLTKIYYKLLNQMSAIDILPNAGDYRLMDRRVVNALISLRETQRYTKGLYCWVGFKKKSVDFEVLERYKGKSTYHFKRLLNLAIEGITSYTTAPLRLFSIIGGFISLLSFLYIIIIVIKTLIWGEPVAGFPTLVCILLLLGGLQLLAIGVAGEYIGRIFNETKKRPPYIIDCYNETRSAD